jgi:predicted dehydrogenase
MSDKRVSRRAFLRNAAAAAAGAAAVPLFIPRHVLGASASGPAPSDKLRAGFIGIGGMGGGHLGNWLGRSDVEIVAVCDVNSQHRDKAKERVEAKRKGCDAYTDFRELLARSDVDVVCIAAPDHWHAFIAIAAAKAGKDMYCEKPMSLTIGQARAMVQTVRRYERVFQTGSQQRSDARFRRACELVRNGRIGKVKEVWVDVGGPSRECNLPEQPVPDYMNWDMWLGPAPWAPYNAMRCAMDYGKGWRQWRDYSGGMMTDWGAHHFDIVQWALGMDESGPVEIAPPDGKNVKHLTYRYADGTVVYHGRGPGARRQILFIGEQGKVHVDRGGMECEPDGLDKQPAGPRDAQLYRSPGHAEDFFRCVRSRKRPICDVEIGCRSVTVCHLGNIAYWLGRPLKWDPEKEDFIGDAEASRWRYRPARAPWHL